MRVIDRVHGFTTGDRALAHPTCTTCLTELDVGVIGVADLTDGCAAASIHVADFSGRHAQLGVSAILSDELHGCTSGAGDLGATQRAELDCVHHGTSRDVAQRQVVARLDISLGAGLDDVTLLDTFRSDDVALLTVCVVQQCDAGGTVRVVLDVSDLGRHAVLVPTLEVDETVLALVTAATMTGGHTAVRVTTASLAEFANQRLLRRRTRKLGEVRDGRVTAACSRRLINADSHNLVLPLTFLG